MQERVVRPWRGIHLSSGNPPACSWFTSPTLRAPVTSSIDSCLFSLGGAQARISFFFAALTHIQTSIAGVTCLFLAENGKKKEKKNRKQNSGTVRYLITSLSPSCNSEQICFPLAYCCFRVPLSLLVPSSVGGSNCVDITASAAPGPAVAALDGVGGHPADVWCLHYTLNRHTISATREPGALLPFPPAFL